MTIWNNQSVNKTTTYTYGNREQLLSTNGYYDWGTHDTGATAYTFDDKGNMLTRNGGAFTWNEDNRLTEAAITPSDPKQSPYTLHYRYDFAGRRILKYKDSGARTRYFFNGLTEEIKKRSAPGAASDTAFGFTEKEDGESASDWYVYDNTPADATVMAVANTPVDS